MIKEKTIELITKGLNEKLKELESFEDLQNFEKEYLFLEDLGLQFYFKMKKSEYEVIDFFETINPKRVEYITSDGVSIHCSLVKNLHRNIRAEFSHHV